jgi:radical SAM protein with 4Fe4S-binding SPASM domain
MLQRRVVRRIFVSVGQAGRSRDAKNFRGAFRFPVAVPGIRPAVALNVPTKERQMIVVWRVVDSCNLACPFCAFDRRLEFPRRAAAVADVQGFARALAAYQAQTGEGVLLSWLGGEPLVWKPLEGLTTEIRSLGLKVSATTNGTSLGSASLREHICSAYEELTISIDGFSAFHDPMRDWKNGFEKLRVWIPMLAERARAIRSPLKLRVNVVLMHQNVEHFAALCAELATWGVREITFNQLGGRDRPEFYPLHRLTKADVDRIETELPIIRRTIAHHGVTLVGGAAYLSRIRASALDQRNPVDDCGPGEHFLFIDERGRVSPCSFTGSDYAVDVRSLRSGDDIATLPMRFQAMRHAHRSTQCDDCLSTQVCDKFRSPAPITQVARCEPAMA